MFSTGRFRDSPRRFSTMTRPGEQHERNMQAVVVWRMTRVTISISLSLSLSPLLFLPSSLSLLFSLSSLLSLSSSLSPLLSPSFSLFAPLPLSPCINGVSSKTTLLLLLLLLFYVWLDGASWTRRSGTGKPFLPRSCLRPTEVRNE